MFLVKGEDEYTYETYVGKSNVPAGKGDICVLTNNVGYATLVVLTDYELSNNNFFAYVADGNAETGLTAQGYGYDVYKVGSVEATRLWDDNNTFSAAYTGTGLYEFTVDNDNNIVSANKRMTDLYATSGTAANSNTDSIWKKDDLTFNRAQVAAAEAAGSIQFETYTNLVAANNDNGYTTTSGKAWKDFAVDKDTIVINVNKTALTGTATLSVGDINDIEAGQVVLVADDGKDNAKVIYVFTSDYTPAPVVPAKPDMTAFCGYEVYGYNGQYNSYVSDTNIYKTVYFTNGDKITKDKLNAVVSNGTITKYESWDNKTNGYIVVDGDLTVSSTAEQTLGPGHCQG